MVGAVNAAAVWAFTRFGVAHLWAVVYFGLGAALLLGLLGIFTGLWSEKFDQLAAVTNFVIMPMTFLSGTFYLVDRLPEPFQAALSHYNLVLLYDRAVRLRFHRRERRVVDDRRGAGRRAERDPGGRLLDPVPYRLLPE